MPIPTADAAHSDFISRLDVDSLVAEGCRTPDADADDVAHRVRTSIEEARNALRLLWPELPEGGGRILEVGAGLGVLSHLLSSLGHEVTAIEPGGVGYEVHVPLAEAAEQWMGGGVHHLDIAGEDLDATRHGVFDLVFSINVVEHVRDVDAFLDSLFAVVAPGGVMMHSCPNYVVPYEPHFGIPLLPIRPAATARMLPARIVDTGLWRSLNFVTIADVRRFAARRGLDIEFHSGQMARALQRCATESEFGSRHGPIVPVAKALHRLRITSLLGRLPAAATTPMVFTIRAPAEI